MAGAGYTVDLTFTDDEAFGFEFTLAPDDDDTVEWPDLSAEYTMRDGQGRGCEALKLSSDSGILEIDPETNRILCLIPKPNLRPGSYRHGLVLTDRESGAAVQIFNGTVTITEGNL